MFYSPFLAFGMGPMNGYLTKRYVHEVIEQPVITSMQEVKLDDLPQQRKTNPGVTAGGIFGAAVSPETIENRRQVMEGKKPLGIIMGTMTHFTEPWNPTSRREYSSPAALDLFYLTLDPHHIAELNIITSPIGMTWFNLRKSISNVQGFQRFFWGCQEECPSNIQVMILWNGVTNQAAFNTSSHRTELWKVMLPYVAPAALNVSVWSVPSLIGYFHGGGLQEIITFYLPERITDADRVAFEYYFWQFHM